MTATDNWDPTCPAESLYLDPGAGIEQHERRGRVVVYGNAGMVGVANHDQAHVREAGLTVGLPADK